MYFRQDIEERHSRFHHDDVRTLFHIGESLLDALAYVVEVHLIGLAVSEFRRGIRGVTEGTVEGGSVFYRIGHDRYSGIAVFIQLSADSQYPAIHHVRWCNHVRTCFRVRKSGFCEKFKRRIIVHVVSVQDAAVAVRGVLTHADVRDIIHIRYSLLCCPEGSLDNSVAVIGSGANFVLLIGNAEDHDGGDTMSEELFQLHNKGVDAVAVLAGHGRNFFCDTLSFHDKNRIYQRGLVKSGFTHHFADD